MWSIDRFEGEYALCENTVTEERCRIPKAQLPPGAQEGSLLRRTPSGWQPAEEEAKARRRALADPQSVGEVTAGAREKPKMPHSKSTAKAGTLCGAFGFCISPVRR